MALAAFDTLEFVDELAKAGIPEKQARAISSAVRKSHESLDVATKQDIAELRHDMNGLRKDLAGTEERTNAKLEKLGAELRHEIHEIEIGLRSDMEKMGAELRHEMGDLRKDTNARFVSLEQRIDSRMAGMKFELLKWFFGIALAQTGLLVTLRLLPIGS